MYLVDGAKIFDIARVFMNPPEADYETGNPLVADAACGAGLSVA